jgi:hypothetical protein
MEPVTKSRHLGESRHPERSSAASPRSTVEGPVLPHRARCSTCLLSVVALSLALSAQTPLFQDPNHPAQKPHEVEYLYPEQLTLSAGKPTEIKLHFRVAPGLHINSHDPKEKFLIPTDFSVPTNSGVRLDGAHYPEGAEFVLPADPSQKLSVYTGEFTIDARLVATPGDHLVQARLHYQACDENACMPPRTITASIDVIAK